MEKKWKILCIGNSFSQDASRLMGQVALATGAKAVRVVNLYIGGCSVRMHWVNARKDKPAYRFEDCRGSSLLITPNFSISQALAADDWDWVCIQQGSSDGSFYSREESYDCLEKLVDYVRSRIKPEARIAFNLTWTGETTYQHREMAFYGFDRQRLFAEITRVTKDVVSPLVDKVCPIGTAIHNARADELGLMTRDGYHLSWGLGRYVAAMTLWSALTDADISQISWKPESVDAQLQTKAVACVKRALKAPYQVTKCQ